MERSLISTRHRSPIDHRLSATQLNHARLCGGFHAHSRSDRHAILGRTSIIGRVIWYAALLAIATVTIAVQMDRQSVRVPSLSTSVPEPVRSFAQAQIAARTLANGDNAQAVVEAKKLAERRPVPAETLRLLAQAQIAAGETEQGALTIQYSAKRGWRDPVAQETMLRLASAAGDEAEAARRYVALLLQNRTEDELLIEFGTQIFADGRGAGAEALIPVLVGTERWPNTFLRRGSRVLPPGSFANILVEAVNRGAKFDCDMLRDVARPVAKRDTEAGDTLTRLIETRCQAPGQGSE